MLEGKAQTEEYIITSDLCNEPRMLERLIVGNYTLGRDAFRVVSSKRISRTHAGEVREIAYRLMGLGIGQVTPERIDNPSFWQREDEKTLGERSIQSR